MCNTVVDRSFPFIFYSNRIHFVNGTNDTHIQVETEMGNIKCCCVFLRFFLNPVPMDTVGFVSCALQTEHIHR